MRITIEIAGRKIITEMTMDEAMKLIPEKTQQALAEHYSECGSLCKAQAMLYGTNELSQEQKDNVYGEALDVCIDNGIADILKINGATILMSSLSEKSE